MTNQEKKTVKATLPTALPRSAARLGAVQALYQMDVAATDLNDIISEFSDHRLGKDLEGAEFKEADKAFFCDLVRGVVAHQRDIDPLLNDNLAEGWRLPRIDSILRAILRSGAYELMFRQDVPATVVLSEYIDVAHAFFEGEEPKVVNGVLDRVAQKHRNQELGTHSDANQT